VGEGGAFDHVEIGSVQFHPPHSNVAPPSRFRSSEGMLSDMRRNPSSLEWAHGLDQSFGLD
jgi:hypothetical protein